MRAPVITKHRNTYYLDGLYCRDSSHLAATQTRLEAAGRPVFSNMAYVLLSCFTVQGCSHSSQCVAQVGVWLMVLQSQLLGVTLQLSRNAMHAYSHFCPLWTQRSTPACYEVNTWALHYPRPCAKALYHLRKFSGSKGWELEFLVGITETSPWRQQSDSGPKL